MGHPKLFPSGKTYFPLCLERVKYHSLKKTRLKFPRKFIKEIKFLVLTGLPPGASVVYP
jgi:hypothetical protein